MAAEGDGVSGRPSKPIMALSGKLRRANPSRGYEAL